MDPSLRVCNPLSQRQEVAVSRGVKTIVPIRITSGSNSFNITLEWFLHKKNISIAIVLEEEVMVITALLNISRAAL